METGERRETRTDQQDTFFISLDIVVTTPAAITEVLLWLFGLYSRTHRQSHPLLAKRKGPRCFWVAVIVVDVLLFVYQQTFRAQKEIEKKKYLVFLFAYIIT